MDFSNHKEYIEHLIINGEITTAIKELLNGTKGHQERLYNDMIQLSGRNSRNENMMASGRIDNGDYKLSLATISHALTSYLAKYEPREGLIFPTEEKPEDYKTSNGNKTVFISYNHKDKELASKIELFLEDKGINVIRDEDSTAPGEDLKEFSINAVKSSDYTLSLISENSLDSVWVMIETLDTQSAGKFEGRKRLIPVYSDKSFLSDDFVDKVYDTMEGELDEVNNRLKKYIEKERDTRFLNTKKTNLKKFLNEVDGFIDTLRGLKSIDLREANFENGMKEIIDYVNS